MLPQRETSRTERTIRMLVGLAAVGAPGTHTLTDIAEWTTGGFSAAQLWVNYVSFLVMPFMIVGLYAVQRPRIGTLGLSGAVLYGISFVYFAHTAQYAWLERVPDYEALLNRLGNVYYLHGAAMVVGGIAFGAATRRVGFFPDWSTTAFLAGVSTSLLLTVISAPELLHTLGSALRNIGLMGMGVFLLRGGEPGHAGSSIQT